ncbi:MAG: hypothetical protein ABFQ65_04520 [Nanoarchaeota archaeon]
MISSEKYDFIERKGGEIYARYIEIFEAFFSKPLKRDMRTFHQFVWKEHMASSQNIIFIDRGRLENELNLLDSPRLLVVQTYDFDDKANLVVVSKGDRYLQDKSFEQMGFDSIYNDAKNFVDETNNFKKFPRSLIIGKISLEKKLLRMNQLSSYENITIEDYNIGELDIPIYQVKNVIGFEGNSAYGRNVLWSNFLNILSNKDQREIQRFSAIVDFSSS